MFTIQTYNCPLFPGFYGTSFDSDVTESNEISSYNQDNNTNLDWDDFEFDYDDYRERVAKEFVKQCETELKRLGIIETIVFEKIDSPRAYNYSNDSIYCSISVNDENTENLKKYIHENAEKFAKFVEKNCSSYDGFISFLPNSFAEWDKETNDFTEFEQNYFVLVLEFVLFNENLKSEIFCNTLENEGLTINYTIKASE